MEPVTATVDDLAHDGWGVVKYDGHVFFVAGGLPGEQIRFSPGRKRRGRRIGFLEEVISPSDRRTEPRCQYFGVCGGCASQHIAPDAQVEFKEKVLFDNLERIGKVTAQNILDPLTGPTWGVPKESEARGENGTKKRRNSRWIS